MLTEDGVESQLGVNHVGHALLVQDLLGVVKQSHPSRIVVLASRAHLTAPKEGMSLAFILACTQPAHRPKFSFFYWVGLAVCIVGANGTING